MVKSVPGGIALVCLIAVAGCGGTCDARMVEAGVLGNDQLEIDFDVCNADVSVDVTETDETVRIAGRTASKSSNDDCLGPAQTVELDRPRGERSVVDGHTDDTVLVLNRP